MVDNKNNECEFNVGGAVYSIKILESVAMKKANEGNDFYFIEGNVPPESGEGIAIPKENIISYDRPPLKKEGLRYNVAILTVRGN